MSCARGCRVLCSCSRHWLPRTWAPSSSSSSSSRTAGQCQTQQHTEQLATGIARFAAPAAGGALGCVCGGGGGCFREQVVLHSSSQVLCMVCTTSSSSQAPAGQQAPAELRMRRSTRLIGAASSSLLAPVAMPVLDVPLLLFVTSTGKAGSVLSQLPTAAAREAAEERQCVEQAVHPPCSSWCVNTDATHPSMLPRATPVDPSRSPTHPSPARHSLCHPHTNRAPR
jgi:hypothetical protein